MCSKNQKQTEQNNVNDESEIFCGTASTIVKKSFLRYVEGYKREELISSWPPVQTAIFPKANMYYAFNEDTNPFERVKNTDFNSFSGSISPHYDPPIQPFIARDPYSENAAKMKYLRDEPTCFVVLGKPDLNSRKLARIIADAWGCVLISPEELIEQEMETNSEKGRRISEILRAGDSLGAKIVMNLIEERIRARDVIHRGYIVEGLPFVRNNFNPDYSSYTTINTNSDAKEESSEIPTICAIHFTDSAANKIGEKQDEVAGNILYSNTCVCDRVVSENSDMSVDLSSWEDEGSYENEIPQEIDDIFTKWSMKPQVIVYMMCPLEDAVKKREFFRTDPETGEIIDINTQYGNIEPENSILCDTYQRNIDDDDKRLLRRIGDTRDNVLSQCKIYERFAMPVIEKWTIFHNPQNVVRVDARTSVFKMFEIISVRLRTLPLPRVILPRKLVDENELEFYGEDSMTRNLESRIEDVVEDLTLKDIVSSRFPWRLSEFKYFCPVELAKGKSVEGKANHCIQFMNNIFFLSSEEAAELFVENPRPFLLRTARPPCKIAIIGPKFSGKSRISEHLANAFDGIVINVKEIENDLAKEYVAAKVNERIQEIVNDVVKELKEHLESERQAKESTRLINLQSWCNDIIRIIDRLNEIFEAGVVKEEGFDADDEEDLGQIRRKLEEYNLEILEVDQRFQDLIKDDINVLHMYAPINLRTEEPPLREITANDPEVMEILNDRVKHLYDQTIDFTVDEKVNIILKAIAVIPEEKIDEGLYRDGNFVLDGMYTDLEIWTKISEESNFIFEDVVAIFEDEPFDRLIDKWVGINKLDSTKEEYHEKEGEREFLELNSFEQLENYIEHIKNYEKQRNDLKFVMTKISRNVIECNLKNVTDVSDYVAGIIESRYLVQASKISEEEFIKKNEMLNLELAENVGDGETEEEKFIDQKDNRQLGDSGIFCPVALFKHKILRIGKEEFTALFRNKIYLFSSLKALDEFVEDPRKFSIPLKQPLLAIPPVRVSVVGPVGCGKTALSKFLSKEYGIVHVDYFKRFSEFMEERAMTSFTPKDFLVSLNEPVEVELPVNLEDEKFNTNKDTVQTFIRQFWKKGGQLPRKIFQETCLMFFKPPYENFGIVFDGFPSCAEDVEAAVKNYAVPEVVIQLKCDLKTCLDRMMPKVLDYWRKKQEAEILAEENKYKAEIFDYTQRKKEWIAQAMKERNQKRREELNFEDFHRENEEYFNIFNSDAEEAAIDETELEELWLQQNPEPVPFTDWENFESAEQRINERLVEMYENDAKKLDAIRKAMKFENITWIEIDATQSSRKVSRKVSKILDTYIYRDSSLLEKTYSVDVETAEKLLDCGYYFLSSFGRFCPVQIYDKKNPFQMFFLHEAQEEIFPVIHREYIYFLGGEEAFKAFTKKPLKYLEEDSRVPLIPLRISIIGPPKCGKTTLAGRFARVYAMKIVSRGEALRYLLENYGWTNVADEAEIRLRNGRSASPETLVRAVEMYSIDPLAVSQGCIFDGFPADQKEYEKLALLNVQPTIILDLKASLNFSLECLSYDFHEEKKPANYSPAFLSRLYRKWEINEGNFRDWLKKFTGNVVELNASQCKWGVWMKADRAVRDIFFSIKKYFRESDYDAVHSLKHMCVSPYEFRIRQSQFEGYCPLCLFHDDILRTSGTVPDSSNVTQFREHFYWICSKHLNEFFKDPTKHLPPTNNARLPKDRPNALDGTVDIDHICWAKRLKVNGVCLVSYVSNFPDRVIVPGKRDFAAVYHDKLFLFCSERCRDDFLARPARYSNVPIHYPYALPLVDVKTLPNLGFLEQTVAKTIVDAVNNVNSQRPKIPCLSADVSAAVHLGIYLKLHNTNCVLKEISIYEEVAERISARKKIIETATRNMKRKLNPYLILPKHM